MKMKSTIFNFKQETGRRLVFCTLAFGFFSLPVFAQSDDIEDEDEVETAIKQPVRKAEQKNYPVVAVTGMVTDLATGKPLAGIQLQALGQVRYTAMTEEDGTFTIKVPTFTTALYVHAPEYMPQQVGIVAGASDQVLSIKMLKDKFRKQFRKRTFSLRTLRSKAK